MATETYTTIQQLPENLQKYQEQMLATVFGTEGQPGLVGTQRPVPDYVPINLFYKQEHKHKLQVLEH